MNAPNPAAILAVLSDQAEQILDLQAQLAAAHQRIAELSPDDE